MQSRVRSRSLSGSPTTAADLETLRREAPVEGDEAAPEAAAENEGSLEYATEAKTVSGAGCATTITDAAAAALLPPAVASGSENDADEQHLRRCAEKRGTEPMTTGTGREHGAASAAPPLAPP